MNFLRNRHFGTCLVAVAAVFVSIAQAADVPIQTSIPTNELDQHFVGVTKQKSYTYAMLELGIRMGAATSAAMGDDPASAEAALNSFTEQYKLVAGLVPSWRKHFDENEISQLAKAVAKGRNKAARKIIITRIEDSCTRCHASYLIPVQARYRWGNFSQITVDSESGNSLNFHTIMVDLSNGFGALRGNVVQGDFDAALKSYKVVRERFTMMELACTACHDEPREYFVDSCVKGRLLRIGGLLRKGSQDVDLYTQELNNINEVSCMPCHQVHMPAAFLQQYWESSKN